MGEDQEDSSHCTCSGVGFSTVALVGVNTLLVIIVTNMLTCSVEVTALGIVSSAEFIYTGQVASNRC